MATTDAIQTTASGAVNPEGSPVVYRYEWHGGGGLVYEGEMLSAEKQLTAWTVAGERSWRGVPQSLVESVTSESFL